MKIRLLATSDIHGAISPYGYSGNAVKQQGLARLAGHIHRLKDKNTLLIDNGDVLEGNPLNFYHITYERETTHPMATALNYLGYDYFNLGNHDFNYGPDVQRRYINDVNAKCITGNVKENETVIGAEYTVHRFDENHSIAIIGVVTQYLTKWEKPENIKNNVFENAFDFVKNTIEKIKTEENVQGIVVVYHGGFERNLETGVATEALTDENLAYKMCAEIDDIDVLISGHQHRSITGVCCGKTVTQTAANAVQLAVVEWDLGSGKIESHLLDADCPVDIGLMEAISHKENNTQKWLDQPLGTLYGYNLLVEEQFRARLHKHPLASFLAQVMLEASGAQLAAIALFNDAKGFSQQITMRDLAATYVYPNTIVVMKITGEVLKQFIEKCGEYFAVENGQITTNKDFVWPKPKHYNYDMITGVDYTLNISLPAGHRLTSLTYGGVPVLDEDEFTIALTNYRASGGGDFDMLKNCEIVKLVQSDMIETIANYLKSHPQLEIKHEENIKIVKL